MAAPTFTITLTATDGIDTITTSRTIDTATLVAKSDIKVLLRKFRSGVLNDLWRKVILGEGKVFSSITLPQK